MIGAGRHERAKGSTTYRNGYRELPRSANLDDIPDKDIQEIVMAYNLPPRITPIQALFKDLGRNVGLRFA